MTRDELIKEYEEGRRDFRDADLREAYLKDTFLRGVDFRGADLRGADLSGADLRCAELSGADLRGADLSGADLICAELSGADLRGANFRGANLDYSSGIPYHCGGLGAKIDRRGFVQHMYHGFGHDVDFEGDTELEEWFNSIPSSIKNKFLEYRDELDEV